jgi:hypothetical protein
MQVELMRNGKKVIKSKKNKHSNKFCKKSDFLSGVRTVVLSSEQVLYSRFRPNGCLRHLVVKMLSG